MTILNKSSEKTETITSIHLRRMVISAMLLAMGLVMRTFFSVDIPLFGASGLRLSVHGIFTTIPAILFGPVYGAIISGLFDFLGHHLRPQGAYIPWLTLTSALGGFIRGALWMLLKNRKTIFTRVGVASFGVAILLIGLINTDLLSRDGVTGSFYDAYTVEMSINAAGLPVRTIDQEAIDMTDMSLISRMVITRSMNVREPNEMISETIMFLTTAMIGSGVLVLLLLSINLIVDKYLFKGEAPVFTTSLLVAMLTAAILVSTLNTWILRFTLPAWQQLPFSLIWLPRVMQSVATTTVVTYFVVLLLGVCQSHPSLRKWVN